MATPATTRRKATPAKKTTTAATRPAVKVRKPGWYTDTEPLLKRYWDGDSFIGGALPADMADAKTPAPTDAEQTQDAIVFRDRAMIVRCPTGDQIGVWERAIAQATSIGKIQPEDTPEQYRKVLKLNTRLQKVVASVLVTEDDKDWLDDRFLEEDLDLEHAAEIITLTVDAFTARQPTQPAPAPKHGPVSRKR